jgi:hypothetical protein
MLICLEDHSSRLHIDTKRFIRFTRPGHAVTRERYRGGAKRRMRLG